MISSFGPSASATSNNASATTDNVSATTDKSPTTSDNASATTENPSATTDNASSTTDDVSATTDNASATTGDLSVTTGDAAATTGDASATSGDALITGVASPTATTDVPSGQPTITDDSLSNPTDDVSTTQNERRHSVIFRRDNSTMPASDNDDEVIANDTEDTFDDTDNADETNDVVSDDSTTADGAEFENDTADALALSADEQSEDDITFNTLVDIQKTFQIVPGTDGNLYTSSLASGSPSDAGLFAESQNIVVGDDEERVLHYYPDEMAIYNVSRIRLSLGSEIPKTADAIALSPIDYDNSDDTPSAYFAVSTKQDVYSLVLCDFSNGADSKVFIINDESGLDSLQNNTNIKYTVTGAPVQACYPLAIISGGNGTVSS